MVDLGFSSLPLPLELLDAFLAFFGLSTITSLSADSDSLLLMTTGSFFLLFPLVNLDVDAVELDALAFVVEAVALDDEAAGASSTADERFFFGAALAGESVLRFGGCVQRFVLGQRGLPARGRRLGTEGKRVEDRTMSRTRRARAAHRASSTEMVQYEVNVARVRPG